MKKIFSILICLIVAVLMTFFIQKSKESPTNIRVSEVTHSVFYAPLYVALEEGYFKDEGLNIELVLTPGADKVSAAVLSGDVQIGFAGSESAIYVFNQTDSDYLQIFAGLTKRDGQFLVSKEKINNFNLKNLYGKTILVGRSTGMPALNFLNALKNMNIDKDKININYSIEFQALSGTFIGGEGDFVNLFEPNALSLERNNLGYVVESIGKLSGEMPYTTFYAKKSYIEDNKNIIVSFRKAINKGLEYVQNHTSNEIAMSIQNQFNDIDIKDLEVIVDRYKNADSWLESTYISEDLLKNIENLLLDNELIKEYVDYNKIVINK